MRNLICRFHSTVRPSASCLAQFRKQLAARWLSEALTAVPLLAEAAVSIGCCATGDSGDFRWVSRHAAPWLARLRANRQALAGGPPNEALGTPRTSIHLAHASSIGALPRLSDGRGGDR